MKRKELVLSAECRVLSAKKILAVALCVAGLAAFARPAGTDYLCLSRRSITPSNVVSDATVTGDTTAELGKGKELKELKLTWDAKADFGDEALHEKIKVKLTVSPTEPD